MAALLVGIPAGVVFALAAWLLGAGWLMVVVAYGLGGTIGTLGVALLGWLFRSRSRPASSSTASKQAMQLARAPVAGAGRMRDR